MLLLHIEEQEKKYAEDQDTIYNMVHENEVLHVLLTNAARHSKTENSMQE